MRAGRFREDFYYRLCSDMITTPSLREQLADAYDNLRILILFIARREMDDEVEDLADEVWRWIDENLGRDYAWDGNIRELEQCVRNVMIRREYRPAAMDRAAEDPRARLAAGIAGGTLTADELLRQYCTLVYAKLENYEATARRLGLDRRTVKSMVDPELLAELQSSERRAV
jgi:transcriptional regulator with PAS, ATPase and Fis domain